MRVLTAAALVVLAVAAVRTQQQPTFRSGTSIVPILATVLDNSGRLVPDLERADFTVLDNGKPQEVVFFQNDVQPFTVVVTMDFSFSMNNNLKLLKAAAEQFILRMLPEDKGQVGAFSDKIMFSGHFTNDRDDLILALNDLQYGNPTRLYDAIDTSIDLLDDASGRKVVLVFTDGDDTASRRSFGDVLTKTKDRIDKASEELEKAGVRRRALERQLRSVDELPEPEAVRLLGSEGAFDADDAPEK